MIARIKKLWRTIRNKNIKYITSIKLYGQSFKDR